MLRGRHGWCCALDRYRGFRRRSAIRRCRWFKGVPVRLLGRPGAAHEGGNRDCGHDEQESHLRLPHVHESVFGRLSKRIDVFAPGDGERDGVGQFFDQ